jgi:acyl-CoA reductase-like NAD-dependent aldehyde dehydrogenase
MTADRLLSWIGGQWVPPGNHEWIDVLAPADESLIAQVGDSKYEQD